jgi:flagellar basal-body rod protein FlgG
MVKGLFRAASGMLLRQTRMEISSNNLANINTTGYKRDDAFARQLIEAAPITNASDGNHAPHSNSLSYFTDDSAASYKLTGNALDVALTGEGFFVVQSPKGQFFTRSGHFMVDGEGKLVDANGSTVLGGGGEITIPDGESAFINQHGEVVVGETVLDKLKVVSIEDKSQLEKVGNSYFNSQNVAQNPIEFFTLAEQSLESSNVDMVQAYVDMIGIQKEYEASQKVIRTTDGTLEKLIRDVSSGIR